MAGEQSTRVLVVEDDRVTAAALVGLLDRAGYDVRLSEDGHSALRSLFEYRPSVILLDLVMPGMNGFEVLDRVREVSDVAVIVLSGVSGEAARVRALQAGADDYVVKPFGRQELIARVGVCVRRLGAKTNGVGEAPQVEEQVIDHGGLNVDLPRRQVHVLGKPIALTPTEFKLLLAFMRNPDQVLGHDQLLELAWSEPGSRTQVKLQVSHLRRKLGPGADWISTVRGFGYRYTPPRRERGAA